MTQTQVITEYQPKPHELALPDRSFLEGELRAVQEFQALAHSLLIEGHDYGIIPGTNKPTLLKPGAEKIAKLLGLSDHYEIVDKIEDWDRPIFRYLVRCELRSVSSGLLVTDCLAECNSMEARYRWRNAQRRCPKCGQAIFQGRPAEEGFYCWKKRGGCGARFGPNDQEIVGQPSGKVPNEDVFSLVNTILKMAQKRALVGAALSAGRLSDVFTQDMEDNAPGPEAIEGDYAEANETPPAPEVPATPSQVNMMWPLARRAGLGEAEFKSLLKELYGANHRRELTVNQAHEMIAHLENMVSTIQREKGRDVTPELRTKIFGPD